MEALANPPIRSRDLPHFQVGASYRRRPDIHDRFGGSFQSGISPSASHPAIFIFTGDSGEKFGYHDRYDASGVFSYTGEGQVGDMTFTKGNKAIRDHANLGRALHVFQANGKGAPCTYNGEFAMASHEVRRGPDRNGHERNIIVFHLLSVAQAESQERMSAPAASAPANLTEARQRAIASCLPPTGVVRQGLRTLYERSAAVRDYVFLRAHGQCEACGNDAPFETTDGRPYLEAHHTTRLSDGGVDHPRFVGAICPTCHSRIHYGVGGPELNHTLMLLLEKKEARIWV